MKKRNDETFLEELKAYMNHVTVVRPAQSATDCCGRSFRREAVVEMPVGLKAAFLKFVQRYRFDAALLEDGKPHYFIMGTVNENNLAIPAEHRDYDGFVETDYNAIAYEGPFVSMRVSMQVKGKVPRYHWQTGVEEVDGIQDHPVEKGVKGLYAQYSRCGDPYFSIDHPWGCGDTTNVVFVKTRKKVAK